MRKFWLTAFIILVLVLVGFWYASRPATSPIAPQADYNTLLANCEAWPNGTATTVPDTTRLFIRLPKDIYPNKELQVEEHGASAGYISNAGPYGEAGQAPSNCWSYYFEFDLQSKDPRTKSGSVVIRSLAVSSSTPDYEAVVSVTRLDTASSSTSTISSLGTLDGNITLGPVCGAEPLQSDRCKPTPAMYAAHPVYVYTSDKQTLITVIIPDATGHFETSLSAGNYWLDTPKGSIGKVLGLPQAVTITKGTRIHIDVSIDTGIRAL